MKNVNSLGIFIAQSLRTLYTMSWAVFSGIFSVTHDELTLKTLFKAMKRNPYLFVISSGSDIITPLFVYLQKVSLGEIDHTKVLSGANIPPVENEVGGGNSAVGS